MSYRARLVIDFDDGAMVEKLLERFEDGAGSFHVQIGEIDVGADGELVRHTLAPRLIQHLTDRALAPVVREPGRQRREHDARMGPLVLIYATRPTEEEQDGEHRQADEPTGEGEEGRVR